MIRLPAPPETFTTRQINCVVCNEQFTISVDSPNAPHRSAAWHRPEPFQSHQQAVAEQGWHNNELVNCPRCHADNRNWLYILAPHDPSTSLNPLIRLEKRVTRAWQRFPAAVVGILLASMLALPAMIIGWQFDLGLGRIFLISIFILLAAIVPPFILTTHWRDWRLERHLRDYILIQRTARQTAVIRGFLLILVFTSLPVIFVNVLPYSFSRLSGSMSSSAPATAVNSSEAITKLKALENRYINEVALFVNALEQVDDRDEEYIRSVVDDFIETTEQAKKDLRSSRRDQEKLLEETVVEATTNIKDAQIEQITKVLQGNFRFIFLWCLLVGLSSFISVAMTLFSLSNFVLKIDAQLPRPIFTNVSEMVRVAMIEMGQSLRMNGELEQIQWAKIRHNVEGGISMIGLRHNTMNGGDPPINTMVQAQRYDVETDKWGHVRAADVRDVRVPNQPVSSSYNSPVSEGFFQDVPSQHRRRP
jgi:hypothetical protein